MTRAVKLSARIAAAVALLALVVWLAHPQHLLRVLAAIDVRVFGLAVILSILANLASAVRWASIARLLGLRAPTPPLVAAYARGVTLNALLPGATLSGDLFRSYQLHQLGNPLPGATLSVMLDRASGLWVLCLMSLGFAATAWVFGLLASVARVPHLSTVYLGLLAAATAAPLVLLFAAVPWLRAPRWGMWAELYAHAAEIGGHLRAPRTLAKQIVLSLIVQLLSAAALWLCARAIGVSLPYWLVAALAAPIFILAAVPVSLGGWGTREVAAVAVLAAVGINAEQAAATSILYGVCAVAQAALAAPLFLKSTPVHSET
jgi:uncharacterized membrane protein YbhN (UPF0104 family)